MLPSTLLLVLLSTFPVAHATTATATATTTPGLYSAAPYNAWASWQAKAATPSPSATSFAATCFRNSALVVENGNTVREYNAALDTWYAHPTLPGGVKFGLAVVRTKVFAAGCGTPTTPYNRVWSLDLTDPTAWVAVTYMPTARLFPAVVGSRDTLYVIAGTDPTGTTALSTVEAYDGTAWATKASSPTAAENSAAEYYNNKIFAVGSGPVNTRVYTYDITTDQWNGFAQAPVDHDATIHKTGIAGGYLYLVGSGNPNPRHVHLHDTLLDRWTTVSSLPAPGNSVSAGCFIGNLGTLVSFTAKGPTNPAPLTHTMYTGFMSFGSVIGDPKFVSFLGDRHDLSLHQGVFNLFTTSTLAVNAMVDIVPTLPPEDNQVMTMIGIIAHLKNTIFLASCGIAADEIVANCSMRTIASPFSPVPLPSTSLNPMTLEKNATRFEFDDAIIYIVPTTVSATAIREGGSTTHHAPASYLNVFVRPTGLAVGGELGLLADLDRVGVTHIRNTLHFYEVENGCLVSPSVPATTTTTGFRDAAVISAGIAC